MNKKIYLSILSTVFASGFALAEAQVTGKLTYESGTFSSNGTTTGASSAHGNDTFKSETSLRVYIDGELDNGSTYHMEVQGFDDGEMDSYGDNFGKHDEYTQRDAFREGYIDTTAGDWNVRLGKQQVVWGTADGMKLLDMINPTDFSEMAQNQMEDSRIPVWMLNAETATDDGGNFQFIVSEPRENVFAGLDRGISTHQRMPETTMLSTNLDASEGHWREASKGYYAAMDTTDRNTAAGHAQGHPFVLKGVDSITGKTNGMLNIVPDIGAVATRFYNEFCQNPLADCAALQGFNNMTVAGFAGLPASYISTNFATYSTMKAFADNNLDGAGILSGFASAYDTNLMSAANSSAYQANKNSAFEYMGNATFATFDAFANAGSQYVYDMPDGEPDVAMKYSNTTEDGTNYSINYAYAYDKNPIINLSWRDKNTGALLKQNYTRGFASGTQTTNIHLTNLAGTTRYGAFGNSGTTAGAPVLRFEQTVERAHNLGGSFDTSIETEEFGPVVIRGEALYQKGVYSPIMDLTSLSVGDLPNALTMKKGDRFKYVIGADVTALTNMMVSLQFIQDRNLNYVDENSIPDELSGNYDLTSLGRFTADYATMSLNNNFNKAEKDKNFYSLYLSKPYGESGQHRWNNIFIYEENGGKWNRIDTEYTINDNTIATAEYNKYWGDENTQFGQLEKASNFQLGVKYTF